MLGVYSRCVFVWRRKILVTTIRPLWSLKQISILNIRNQSACLKKYFSIFSPRSSDNHWDPRKGSDETSNLRSRVVLLFEKSISFDGLIVTTSWFQRQWTITCFRFVRCDSRIYSRALVSQYVHNKQCFLKNTFLKIYFSLSYILDSMRILPL